MKFIKLKLYVGGDIYLNLDNVTSFIRQVNSDKTHVYERGDDDSYSVKETPEQIMSLIAFETR
jgi:hypothetical protein